MKGMVQIRKEENKKRRKEGKLQSDKVTGDIVMKSEG